MEGALLEAARRGDEHAFQELISPLVPEIRAHCRRMLGSAHDAEDGLQEVLLKAWRGIGRFEARSSLRAWLYRIATNTCLSYAETRAREVAAVDAGGAGVQAGPEVHYERRESIELACMAMLQVLPARQRAVLILREVLGFSAKEAAELLGTTTAGVNSTLQRARRSLERRQPATCDDKRLRATAAAYVAALDGADVEAIVDLGTRS